MIRDEILNWRGTEDHLKTNFTGQNAKNIHPNCIYYALSFHPTTGEPYYKQYMGSVESVNNTSIKKLIPIDPSFAISKHITLTLDEYNALEVKDPDTYYYVQE